MVKNYGRVVMVAMFVCVISGLSGEKGITLPGGHPYVAKWSFVDSAH